MKTILKRVLFVLIFVPLISFAQNTVSGTITEQATSSPLPGVNVVIKGTTTGTATDFDGNYQIDVNTGDVLVFSYVGYVTQEVTYSGQSTIDIALVEDAAQLDEVVVIGYGTAKKEDLTGTTELVTEDDFNKGPIVSAQQLITGKVAGVSITSGSGAPGEGQEIRIRGNGSLSLNNNPLIVLDGVPIEGGIGGSRNPLNMINPNDIESMVVLKDASATAIYGSRAANGVILITTKKGKSQEFRFNLNSFATFYTPVDEVDVLSASQFTELVTSTGNASAIALLGGQNTNWQDLIYRDAIGHDHTFSANGLAGNVPTRFSLGYSNQEGILETDQFERITASFKLNPSFMDDYLKFEINGRGAYEDNTFGNRGAIGAAVAFDPTQSPYTDSDQYDGYFSWLDPNTGRQLNLATTNPLALLNLRTDDAEVRRFIGNTKADYKLHFFPDITATVNVGIDYASGRGRTVTSAFMPTSEDGYNGSRYEYTNESKNKLFDAYLTYNKTFSDKHDLTAVAGYSYQSFEFYNTSYNSDLEEDGVEYEFIDKSKNVLLSYFGRFNYGFDNRYLLTATLRADASSKLNPGDRWGYFPSVALAWNIHNESFMNNQSLFNELKVRVGYGEIGNVNGLGDYLFLTRYTGSQQTADYQFGGGFYQTYRPEPINENLKWEVGKTLNLGLDYALLNRRIYGSVNVYKKETNDLIANTFVDPFTNFGNRIQKNIGDMENKGVEVLLNVVPFRSEDFEWTVSYNVAFNDNKVTNLPDQQFVGGISGGVGNNIQTHIEGETPNSFLVYQQVYDEETGRPIEGVFVDRNGDDIINDDDRYIYKSPFADVLMGLNTSVSYKNWDLSVVTRASLGNYAYDNVASSTSYLMRATQNGILTNLHSDYYNAGFNEISENSLLSDYYIQEASFFKIDNITLGCALNNLLDDINLRVYGSVQNVLTVTDYDGLDPEIYGGIDNNFYPRPRSFVFGVNIDF